MDVAISGDFAYVADYLEGLRVVDVNPPIAPIEVGSSIGYGGGTVDVATSGALAFVAELSGGLRIINVTTPSTPVEIAAIPTMAEASSVAVSGSYAFVAVDWAGIEIYQDSQVFVDGFESGSTAAWSFSTGRTP